MTLPWGKDITDVKDAAEGGRTGSGQLALVPEKRSAAAARRAEQAPRNSTTFYGRTSNSCPPSNAKKEIL